MTELDEHAPRRRPPRQLAIDLAELAYAVENCTWEMPYFLDLDTGKLIFIIDEVRGQYNALAESLSEVDLAQWTQAFEVALAELHLPDWEQAAVREVDQVEAGFGKRFIRVPPAEPREGYGDMEAFIETVTDERLAD